MRAFVAFQEWVTKQWQSGNRGGAILAYAVVVFGGWWLIEKFFGYFVAIGLAVYFLRRYFRRPGHAPPRPVTASSPGPKVTVMPRPPEPSSTSKNSSTNYQPPSMKISVRLVSIVIALVIVGILFTRFLVVIPAGTVGVYSLFGKVSPNEMSSGLNLVNPLGKVEKMSIRTEQYTMSVAREEGNRVGDDSIDALTKEGLQLKLDITVLYSLQSAKASDVYVQLGRGFADKVIRPEIRSAIREVAAQYDANAVYSEKRTEMTTKIDEALAASLLPRGITVEDVLLRNVILPQKLSDSIQEKLQADQEQQRYDFVLQKEEKEAERKRIEAAGQRDAQKIIADGLTPNYLNYLYIQNLKENKGTVYVPTDPSSGLPLFRGVNQ